ncbi:hypothetical protein PPL_05333 [Heterostelium album PN500]|uniref:GH18 domain-containing protein n=1 Tax=Heterostelium pallidum (strain ATCC 26659 / Pp 5 / PN500) TaxID=670386 RepID=D3B9W3_HETP5|nr:hypothetical protein PPL_05333 [Heterostelium album PN500]EFA81350.1 hypothetical protein PPL_05333 [Heterostelium album PN500]|eukprot:XP_020433468.1 hypothetical protein PPL_05333 [Heterostelium album PN500]
MLCKYIRKSLRIITYRTKNKPSPQFGERKAIPMHTGSILATFPPGVDYNNKQFFGYLTLYNSTLSSFSNIINWTNYTNIVTEFDQWDPSLLTELIEYSHQRGVAVHHMHALGCSSGSSFCNDYFANSQYIYDIDYMAKMGGDGFHMDIEGSFDYDTYKEEWTKEAFGYLKSKNNNYIGSLAVGCYSPEHYNSDYADFFILMCYDMGWGSNPLAPNSPIATVRARVEEWKPFVNHLGKIIIGLPIYGYFADCVNMDYGLFGTTCHIDGENGNNSTGISGIYQLENQYSYVSYQTLPTGEPFANVVTDTETWSIRQYQYDTPASLYAKTVSMGVGGTAIWRLDFFIGLQTTKLNSFYVALSPNNL